MKKPLILVATLLLGGCLSGNGSDLDARSDIAGAGQSRNRGDKDSGKPRQVCEHTSIGGEAKTFCY